MILITWNVQWFCGLDGRVDVARVVHAARELGDFDVLCLQEVACNYPRLAGDAGADQAAQLAALLPGFEIAFGAAVDERGPDDDGSPFQAKPHTHDALLTGDFNFETSAEEYALLTAAGDDGAQLHDSWRRVHGERPHDPTFRLFDRTYGPVPLACDFVFASASLAPRLRRVQVDLHTQASDHQPVLVELADS